jgi:CheY-like chemotaxis protein
LVVRDGQEAVDYLAGNKPYNDRTAYPFPALVLLDLKMPRMSGFDVLAWLADRSEFKHLPLVVLSSSSDDSDREKARLMGAKEYFVKPHSLLDLVKIIQDLADRWLSTPHSKLAGKH